MAMFHNVPLVLLCALHIKVIIYENFQMVGWAQRLWAATSSLIVQSICFGLRRSNCVKRLVDTLLSPVLPGNASPLSIEKGRAVLYRDTILRGTSMQYITKLALSQSPRTWYPLPQNIILYNRDQGFWRPDVWHGQ